MLQIKQLTKEIKAELKGKTTEERRVELTNLHQQGYNIRLYLLETMNNSDGAHSPENFGFKFTTFSDDRLWLYSLKDNKTTFFYRELPDKTYEHWLA